MQTTALGPLDALRMVPWLTDGLWNMVLLFIIDHHQEPEVSEAVKEGLLRWDRLPTELGLVQLMAKLTVPQRSLQFIWGIPEHVIRLGDIGIGVWRDMPWCSLMTQYSDPPGTITITVKAWSNMELFFPIPKLSEGWQSYLIGAWEANNDYKVVVQTSNKNNKAGDRALWRNLQERSEEVADFHEVPLNRLEIVVDIKFTIQVSCESVEETPKSLYFHRQPSNFASAREFWGFFSLSDDPTFESMDGAAQSETHFQTLMLSDSQDQAADDILARELGKMPGSFHNP